MTPRRLHFDSFGSNEKGIYGSALGLAITRWMLKNEAPLVVPEYTDGKVSVGTGEAGTFALDGDKLYYADSQHEFPSINFYHDSTPKWNPDAKIHVDCFVETGDREKPHKRVRREAFIEYKTGKNATTERNQQIVMEALSRNIPVQNLNYKDFIILRCVVMPDTIMKKMRVTFFRFSDGTGWEELLRYEYTDVL